MAAPQRKSSLVRRMSSNLGLTKPPLLSRRSKADSVGAAPLHPGALLQDDVDDCGDSSPRERPSNDSDAPLPNDPGPAPAAFVAPQRIRYERKDYALGNSCASAPAWLAKGEPDEDMYRILDRIQDAVATSYQTASSPADCAATCLAWSATLNSRLARDLADFTSLGGETPDRIAEALVTAACRAAPAE